MAEAIELQEIQKPCVEMLEAWYGGDGDKMYLIDVRQVAKVAGRWVVVNVLWTTWRTPPWF